MQLLKITSSPMKYEFEVESARLEYQQDFTPSCDVDTSASEMSINSENAQIHIDTYEARKSLGIANIDDCIQQYAAKGKEHINKLTQEYVQIGKSLSQIQNDVGIGDIVRQKMLEQPELVTTFLPDTGAELTYEPGKLDMSYKPADVSLNWQTEETSLRYQPGSFKMKIIEYPHIDIEYLGGPMYVPPSADPNYEETKA